MKPIATFSNGFTDTYHGRRPVTAAWMLTDKESGKVLASGHSLDRQRAEKTARNTINDIHFADLEGHRYYLPRHASWMTKDYAKQLLGHLREGGVEIEGKVTVRSVYDAAKRANARYLAAKRERCAIEVVDL